jgi:hypothetical protein
MIAGKEAEAGRLGARECPAVAEGGYSNATTLLPHQIDA